jgi:UDP-N-acetylmuramoyl-tripeptide--D-alanyl-D-alanine ligase
VFAAQGKHFSDINLLGEYILSQLAGEQRDITILVKGSRSAKMERVVQALEGSNLGKFERVRERIAC